MDFTEKIVTADDGAELAVWDSRNEGIPVVFVHGFPETHQCWDAVIRCFACEDIRSYRIITYDLRGFGDSSKIGEASLNRFYYDHQAVISALQLPRHHLVGHDWGGAVALHVARYLPQSVLSLAVMNTNYWKTDLFGMWHLIFFNFPRLPEGVFRHAPDKAFVRGLLGSFVRADRLSAAAKNAYLSMFRDPETTRYWIKLYRNMGRMLIRKALPGLAKWIPLKDSKPPARSGNAYRADIRLIWGAQDRFNPVWVCRDLESRLIKRGAAVAVDLVAGAGHFVQEEQPEKVAACLLGHWRRHPDGS